MVARKKPSLNPARWLITGDWHADAVTHGFERFGDVERFARELCARALAERARIIFLGDLCNPMSARSPRAMALAVEIARQLEPGDGEIDFTRPVWLAGNHDVVEDGSGSTTLSPIASMSPLVFTRPCVTAIDGVQVIALPHVERGRSYDPDDFVRGCKANPDLPTVVLGHLTIEGASMGSEVDMPRGCKLVMPTKAIRACFGKVLVFNGHYHQHQEVGGVLVPGAPERLRQQEWNNVPPGVIAFDVGLWQVEWSPRRSARPMLVLGPGHSFWCDDVPPLAKLDAGTLVIAVPPAGYDPARLDQLRACCELLSVLPPSDGAALAPQPESPATGRIGAAIAIQRAVERARVADREALRALVESLAREVGL